MHVWVKSKFHTHTRRGWRFAPLLHTFRKGLQFSPVKCRCLLRVLRPVRRLITTLDFVLWKDKYLVLTVGRWSGIIFRACLWVLIRSSHITIFWLSIQWLIFFPYVLPGDPQGRLRSNKMVKSTISCELVGQFRFLVPQHVQGPKKHHRMLGGNVIQRISVLLHQWRRCSNGLKGFQSRLAATANTNIFLWSNIRLNLVSTDQDIVDFGLENCSVFS